ncbi:MAG: hypothetical protein JNJ78_11915 [Anaerolineae bacterium]|nr:hypothetical protein [Anaerolineae bacterium]
MIACTYLTPDDTLQVSDMHSKLIKANIALLQGMPAEVQRLLQEVRDDGDLPAVDLPLLLWLDAQSRPTPTDQIEALRLLISQVPPENPYAALARQRLEDEAAYRSPEKPPISTRWQPLALAAAFTLVGVVITLGLVALFNQTQPVQSTADSAADSPATPTPPVLANLPDNSQVLAAERYTARYPAGILQVLALENDSARVVTTGDGLLTTPILGARFYALHLNFECRSGICDRPPEARVSIILNDGTALEPRTGLGIAGQTNLQPVALGRATSGWVIFEVPLVSNVNDLLIAPRISGEFDPITLSLRE